MNLTTAKVWIRLCSAKANAEPALDHVTVHFPMEAHSEDAAELATELTEKALDEHARQGRTMISDDELDRHSTCKRTMNVTSKHLTVLLADFLARLLLH